MKRPTYHLTFRDYEDMPEGKRVLKFVDQLGLTVRLTRGYRGAVAHPNNRIMLPGRAIGTQRAWTLLICHEAAHHTVGLQHPHDKDWSAEYLECVRAMAPRYYDRMIALHSRQGRLKAID